MSEEPAPKHRKGLLARDGIRSESGPDLSGSEPETEATEPAVEVEASREVGIEDGEGQGLAAGARATCPVLAR